ncbi:type II toxin-antitoxin system RelB/DinJ family antitoxin [Aminobacter sp. UC22_36]|uniref:type II toxin-antitoxin system RelB/DinJ family antitoxin n=1 Tax=Aminobacter sp. UC22_36 TaxID=3374549 RepID=UPI0037578145
MRLTAAMIENIRLRVTPEEKRRFAEVARKRGVTLSDLVRLSLTEATKRVAA